MRANTGEDTQRAGEALQHTTSTAGLTDEILSPFVAALDEVIAAYAKAIGPLPAMARRDLLAALLKVHYAHRELLVVLLRDASRQCPISIDPRWTIRIERLVILLAGEHPTSDHRVVAKATIGILSQFVIDPSVAVDDEHTHRLILAMALDVAKRLGTEASRSWADRHRAPESPPSGQLGT